jgi:NAD(P)-dependent dehydrogenase (short-subunit alcohol dehydrogenase family)
MSFDGATALVTGAGSPLGQAFVRALLNSGAAMVFVDAPDHVFVGDARVRPIRLDVCSAPEVSKAARECGDIDLLVLGPPTGRSHRRLARRQMDGAVYGLMRMAEVFGPALARRRGALVNVLPGVDENMGSGSQALPAMNSAARAVTDALRLDLKSRGVAVVGVFPPPTNGAAEAGARPQAYQRLALRALEAAHFGHTSVYADTAAEELWSGMAEAGDAPVDLLQGAR